MRGILGKLTTAQVEFALEDDSLVALLEDWLQSPRNIGREIATGTLRSELVVCAELLGLRLPWLRNSRSFGRYLASAMPALKQRFTATERAGHSRVKLVSLAPRPIPIATGPAQGHGEGSVRAGPLARATTAPRRADDAERHLRSHLSGIPHVHIGGRVVIPVDAAREWLKDQAVRTRDASQEIVDEITADVLK